MRGGAGARPRTCPVAGLEIKVSPPAIVMTLVAPDLSLFSRALNGRHRTATCTDDDSDPDGPEADAGAAAEDPGWGAGLRDHFIGGPLELRSAKLAALLALRRQAAAAELSPPPPLVRYEDVVADQAAAACGVGAAYGLVAADPQTFVHATEVVGPGRPAAEAAARRSRWQWVLGPGPPLWLGGRRRRYLPADGAAVAGPAERVRLAAVCAGLDWQLELEAGYAGGAERAVCGQLLEYPPAEGSDGGSSSAAGGGAAAAGCEAADAPASDGR